MLLLLLLLLYVHFGHCAKLTTAEEEESFVEVHTHRKTFVWFYKDSMASGDEPTLYKYNDPFKVETHL